MFLRGFSASPAAHGHQLDAAVREGGVDEGGEEAEEAAEVAGDDVGGADHGVDGVLLHGAGVLPVPEAEPLVQRVAAQVDDEGHDEQTADSDQLDGGEHELGLAVDGHGEDVEGQHEGE